MFFLVRRCIPVSRVAQQNALIPLGTGDAVQPAPHPRPASTPRRSCDHITPCTDWQCKQETKGKGEIWFESHTTAGLGQIFSVKDLWSCFKTVEKGEGEGDLWVTGNLEGRSPCLAAWKSLRPAQDSCWKQLKMLEKYLKISKSINEMPRKEGPLRRQKASKNWNPES